MVKLIRSETRLFLRDPASVLVVLALPVALVALFGVIARPGEGDAAIKTYFPAMALALGLAQLTLNLVPGTLVGYRERGVLRRMAASPVGPGRLLGAQLAVGGVLSVVSLVLVVAVGTLGFGFETPARAGATLIVFVLGTLALFAVGMLVAALAPSTRAATGIGVGVMFASLIFGGVFMPAENLPDFMVAVGGYTPLGAFTQALRASWAGAWPEVLHLGVMAGWAALCGLLSARLFRWE
ncbi:ABC transporter permease [Sinosporangium siamense]|uniref:Transport permease protein n=1 Tax=Sinosporangium siamense TaxID=1367973 RepID=A0A919V7Z8_9ACTN|nr:ABC transporter permease [Sinosporangium siamense]GII92657.1 transport permease protein [Sinosporangium siamense]